MGDITLLVRGAGGSAVTPSREYKFKDKKKREFLYSIKISDAAA